MHSSVYVSPIGKILLESDGEHLVALRFVDDELALPALESSDADRVLEQTARWLDDYFSGRIPSFTPPLLLRGTPFRMTVWDLLKAIPYGATVSYADIARQIAVRRGISRMSAQAVGGAVGHNPIAIIVPCHRVIGSDGSLTGYAAGLDRKRSLLDLERGQR